MSFTGINAELSKNQTQHSLICQAINAYASRKGYNKAFVTHEFVNKHSHGIHPDCEIVLVPLRCDGTIIRHKEGKFVYENYYSTTNPANGYSGNITVTASGDVMVTAPSQSIPVYSGNIHDLTITEPEWTKWVDPKVVEAKEGSMTVQEALTAIQEATEALDPRMKSPFSHGGKRVLAPSFVQTATEGAVAYAKTEYDNADIFLTTFMRANMPLPYGGIDGKKADKYGFTQEDKIQMKGNDFQRLPISLKARKSPKLDGQMFDTKLIASVSSPFFSHIPVEAFKEDLAKNPKDPSRFIWEEPSLWTWSAKHTADVVYVIRNKAYFVSKESLRLRVKEEVRRFKDDGYFKSSRVKPNTIKKGESYKQNKWCVYLTETDLLEISYQVLNLPQFYGELLAKHAEEVVDFYDSNNGDDYIIWHLKNYAPSIKKEVL